MPRMHAGTTHFLPAPLHPIQQITTATAMKMKANASHAAAAHSAAHASSHAAAHASHAAASSHAAHHRRHWIITAPASVEV